MNRMILIVMTLFAVLVTGTPALAEEMIVTVRKSEESLQDVPVAVTALSFETMERASVQALDDVAQLTPGLTMQDFNVGALSTPVIRGLAQANTQGRENNVGMFMDGIYLPGRNNMDLELLDLERIEVVKGPQGGLYGRSTFSGAINYVTKAPSDELDLKVQGSAGSDEYYDAQVNLSGPLTETLSGTAAVAYREFDGTIKNEATGDNLGGYENTSVMAKLIWEPTDSLYTSLTGYYTDQETESVGIFLLDPNCGDNGFGGPTYWCGTLPNRDPVSEDPNATGGEADTTLVALEIAYDFGSVTLTSLTGYTTSEWNAITDYDGDANGVPYNTLNPVDAVNLNTLFFNDTEDDTISQELRLDGGGDTFEWLAGLYWTTEETESNGAVTIDGQPLAPGQTLAPVFGVFDWNGFVTDTPTQPNDTATESTGDIDIYAVFGRAQWTITDRHRLSVEARFSREEKEVNVIKAFGGPPTGVQSDNWEYFTPRVTYDFSLTDNIMLYASAAGGTKSGGFNTVASAFPEELTYDEETNITYEVGSKGVVADGRLRYDLAIFYIDWDDMQVAGASQDPTVRNSIVYNTGAATSQGLEIQLDGTITDWLSAGGGYAYVDPEFDNGTEDRSIANLCGDGTLCDWTDVGGQQIGRTVKNQLNLYADLHARLAGDWSWYARVDYIYRDEMPVRSANLQFTDTWSLFNARLGVTNENWDIAIWGKNIFDEDYNTSQLRQPQLNDFSYPTTVVQGSKQQIALTVTFRL